MADIVILGGAPGGEVVVVIEVVGAHQRQLIGVFGADELDAIGVVELVAVEADALVQCAHQAIDAEVVVFFVGHDTDEVALAAGIAPRGGNEQRFGANLGYALGEGERVGVAFADGVGDAAAGNHAAIAATGQVEQPALVAPPQVGSHFGPGHGVGVGQRLDWLALGLGGDEGGQLQSRRLAVAIIDHPLPAAERLGDLGVVGDQGHILQQLLHFGCAGVIAVGALHAALAGQNAVPQAGQSRGGVAGRQVANPAVQRVARFLDQALHHLGRLADEDVEDVLAPHVH